MLVGGTNSATALAMSKVTAEKKTALPGRRRGIVRTDQ